MYIIYDIIHLYMFIVSLLCVETRYMFLFFVLSDILIYIVLVVPCNDVCVCVFLDCPVALLLLQREYALRAEAKKFRDALLGHYKEFHKFHRGKVWSFLFVSDWVPALYHCIGSFLFFSYWSLIGSFCVL
jgi:hypothetical protein